MFIGDSRSVVPTLTGINWTIGVLGSCGLFCEWQKQHTSLITRISLLLFQFLYPLIKEIHFYLQARKQQSSIVAVEECNSQNSRTVPNEGNIQWSCITYFMNTTHIYGLVVLTMLYIATLLVVCIRGNVAMIEVINIRDILVNYNHIYFLNNVCWTQTVTQDRHQWHVQYF